MIKLQRTLHSSLNANSEQFLFEAFLDALRIFGSVEDSKMNVICCFSKI